MRLLPRTCWQVTRNGAMFGPTGCGTPIGARAERINGVSLATAAAFTAAVLSLVNVVVTARFTRQGQLEQWRRDTERPIVANILTLSGDAQRVWMDTAFARRAWIGSLQAGQAGSAEEAPAHEKASSSWQEGFDLFEKLRYEAAQLSLVADAPVRAAAEAILKSHESVRHWLRPASGADNFYDLWLTENNGLAALADRLIDATRVDIGVHRTPGRLFRRRRTLP